jgi:hypothetical protein
MSKEAGTPFSLIYDVFLGKITDDMYLELTEIETYRLLSSFLFSALHKFSFPRVDLTDYVAADSYDEISYTGIESGGKEVTATTVECGYFNSVLTEEEINIIATYMIVEWLGTQLASVELARMKYTGSDFKFTSQANHMQKLLLIKKDYEREGLHLQRLYSRRKKDKNGVMKSTFGSIMSGE